MTCNKKFMRKYSMADTNNQIVDFALKATMVLINM